MTVTTKKIAERTCDAKPRKAPQRDRQAGQGGRGAARAPRCGGDEHSATRTRLRAQARAAAIEAAALALLGAAGALLGPQAAMALAGLALLAMALRSHRMEGRADPARSAPAATCADSPPVQEDRGGAKPGSPASARRPRTPRPDEKGASATPSRTKAKAAHGRRGALRRDSLGRFAPKDPDMPPADPAAPRARRNCGRAKRVLDFPGLEAAGPDSCGDAAHSANRPDGGNGRRRRNCRDSAKGPRRGVSPARAKRGPDSPKPDAPEPGSRSVAAHSGNRQLGGGWRRFLDVLDWPRDRRRSAVPARARRSPGIFNPCWRQASAGGMRRNGWRACGRRRRGDGAGKRRSAVRSGVRASHPRAAGDGRGARLRGMADRAETIWRSLRVCGNALARVQSARAVAPRAT